MPLTRVLLVEPESTQRLQMRNAVDGLAAVDAEPSLPAARQRLMAAPYDWLVTNIRVQAYNGLHLAYLAKMAQQPINVLVYGEGDDLLLAREAQQLGAFFESRKSIVNSLAGYLTARLPPADRRDPGTPERRSSFRGGRRRADLAGFSHTVGVRRSGAPLIPFRTVTDR